MKPWYEPHNYRPPYLRGAENQDIIHISSNGATGAFHREMEGFLMTRVIPAMKGTF